MKLKSSKWYKKKIDTVRSEYVRRKESNWKGQVQCFTCFRIIEWKEADAGHFYLRQHDWTTELGGDERNVQAQCSGCNRYMRGRPQTFALNLVRIYGQGILQKLQNKKDTPKKWKLAELEVLLARYQGLLKRL